MKNRKLSLPVKNLLIFLLIFALAIGVSTLLSRIHADNNPFAVPVFILAVALIARFTNGYFYGIAASALSVLCVNYLFTYPFYELDLRLAGYPLTFATMLIVVLLISTLTTQIKKQEQLRFEVEKEKLRANLLRSVSHDIRTPLTSILGASSAIMENRQMQAADRDELVAQINKDARWLVRLIENILSVTKFSTGDVALEKTDEVVEEIVSSAIMKFHHAHPDIPVKVARPDQILLVSMNATLIEQVLLNLLDNAVVHGQTTTRIQLTVSCEPGRVLFSVQDNGMGVPPQQLAHLFDGYTGAPQGGHGDARRNNLGIGLSVCSCIIRAHAGEMSAENLQQGGAVFRFWLPYEEQHHAY